MATAVSDQVAAVPVPRRTPVVTAIVVAVAALAVAVSVVWGWHVQLDDRVKLGAAPLVGAWVWRPSAQLLPAILLAVAGVALLPRFAARRSFGAVATVTGLLAAAFTLALAAADGGAAVLAPVVHPTEYWANLPTLPPPAQLLHRYGDLDFLLQYSVHVKGHPPGFLLLLQGLQAVGLGHPWAAGALSYVGAAVLPVAVLVTLRAVAGEAAARGTAPFLVFAPYALWMGTSADAVYTATGAGGVALVALAVRAGGRWSAPIAFAGGLLLGWLAFSTYGVVTFLPLPLAVIALTPGVRWRIRGVAAASASAGIAVVVALFAALGFWWLTGLRNTQTLYWWGTAQFRPTGYFLVADLAVAAIAIGPAVVVGIGALRDRSVWILVGAALVCIAIADASRYSKGEVERIWLLFYPWLAPAAVALRHQRRWLAAQAGLCVVLQAWLVSKW